MMKLGDIARASGGSIRPESEGMRISRCVIDSREAGRDSLFFALHGTRTDGHSFVDQVLQKGGMAVVSRGDVRPGIVKVESVEQAMLDCAGWRRKNITSTVVAITGSSGKTTSRLLLTAALKTRFTVYGTSGNLNNQIGLPLVLLNAPEPDSEIVVLEMGMNHSGELLQLGTLSRPDHCLITNVGRAHMEFFDSEDGIAVAKAELIRTTSPGGFCVLPAGQEILRRAASSRGLHIRSFGLGGDAWLEDGDGGSITIMPWKLRLNLRLAGLHNYVNATAAALMADLLGVDLEASIEAMSEVRPAGGRGRRISSGPLSIIDESYNANPDSTIACLRVLESIPGKRVAVLGDMLELGHRAQQYHREILRLADSIGLDLLILTGGIYRSVADSVHSTTLLLADDWKDALELFREKSPDECTVLVKGSNSMRLGEMVRHLEEGD
jgi:UDP-N-acetylmuramoyl-tripeptide--D-alanyl-D-alanine ligase